MRDTSRDESQSVPSQVKLYKTMELELPIFEGFLSGCWSHSAGCTRTFLHPCFPVSNDKSTEKGEEEERPILVAPQKAIKTKHINIFLMALAGQSFQGQTGTCARYKRDKMATLLWNETDDSRFVPWTGPCLSHGRVPVCPRHRSRFVPWTGPFCPGHRPALSGTGDSQRDSRESIRANHSQLKPLFL